MQEWNAQRTNALSRALNQMLYPLLEKELKLKLLQEAKNFVVKVSLQITSTGIKPVKFNLTTPIPTVSRASVADLVFDCEGHPSGKLKNLNREWFVNNVVLAGRILHVSL